LGYSWLRKSGYRHGKGPRDNLAKELKESRMRPRNIQEEMRGRTTPPSLPIGTSDQQTDTGFDEDTAIKALEAMAVTAAVGLTVWDILALVAMRVATGPLPCCSRISQVSPSVAVIRLLARAPLLGMSGCPTSCAAARPSHRPRLHRRFRPPSPASTVVRCPDQPQRGQLTTVADSAGYAPV
jgi:hypothetical protein